ncbi:MAG: DUF2147 domain-containing protein [Flavipsychrobacter sp.]|nr:DUF2147 domain-containing protein [Flavipsychrobacter sp.]
MKKYWQRLALLLAIIFGIQQVASAQADPIERVWLNGAKSGKVQIYKAKNGKYYGKIVWLAEPNRDGKPKLDINNPDKSKQSEPLMGMLILKGFKKDGDTYEDGTIYDPKNGKTYSCKMTLKGKTLEVRGYVGVSMLGRTDTWTIAE